ncbi:MAG: hypothetical protein HQK51_07585 [Oligoflexia bacterium]|nr:hypothetical protein [Oligoflexia bacterium]
MLTKIIRKLLPPEEKIFYTLFDESIDIAHEAAKLLHDMYINGMSNDKIDAAIKLKDKNSYITHKLLEQLSTTFVTPIDREDIQSVAVFINKITKRIVKVIKNSKNHRLYNYNDHLKKQSELLLKMTEELKFAVNHLKKSTKPKDISESGNRMRNIENMMETELKDASENLFSNETKNLTSHDVLITFKIGGLYRDIESACESCNTLSDIIFNIVLKNS